MADPVSEEAVRTQLDVIEANLDAHHPGRKTLVPANSTPATTRR
jgi:hypothetical protein